MPDGIDRAVRSQLAFDEMNGRDRYGQTGHVSRPFQALNIALIPDTTQRQVGAKGLVLRRAAEGHVRRDEARDAEADHALAVPRGGDGARAIVGATGRPTLELGDGWQRYLQYGSGAWWRVLLGRSFDLLLILALPAFAVAVLRRRSRARKLRQRMERHAELYPADFELEPAPMPPLELHGPPPPEIRP